MSLLDKFSAVTITAETDSRIAAADREFCEAHQRAYDAARQSLRELADAAKAAEQVQRDIVDPLDTSMFAEFVCLKHHSYFSSGSQNDCEMFKERLLGTHKQFIENLVRYFKRKYAVELDDDEICDRLLPKKPSVNYWSDFGKKLTNEYNTRMDQLSIQWTDVLDLILIQLGGGTFAEKADSEIKEKCRNAVWNRYKGTADFQRKKAVISFTRMCSHTWSTYEGSMEMFDDGKTVIMALSHFDSDGATNSIPVLQEYLDYRFHFVGKEESIKDDCNKLSGIKCFKNGRVDIRFKSEALARQFVQEYCGTIPPDNL